MRGISKIVSTIILLSMVVGGAATLWHVFNSNLSAFGEARIIVDVRGSYDGTSTTLLISISNSGGRVAVIKSVSIDGIDVTADLGIGATGYNLPPGGEIQKVITRNDIGPGRHTIIVVYDDQGVEKETYAEFSI